jgi:hypothetical protein
MMILKLLALKVHSELELILLFLAIDENTLKSYLFNDLILKLEQNETFIGTLQKSFVYFSRSSSLRLVEKYLHKSSILNYLENKNLLKGFFKFCSICL